jgi:hypothetical protein
MTKANGDEVGHVLYDAYGAVLTSTLPATLTTTLAGSGDVPDPDTGLIYLGAGRWYDPALGRPLQPNPVGGPPTLPQALNRYSATPWGPPGVAEGVGGSGNFIPLIFGPLTLSTLSSTPAKATIVALSLARPLQKEILYLVIETSLRDFNRSLRGSFTLREQFVSGSWLRRFGARLPFFKERLTTVRIRSSNPLSGILPDGDAIVFGTGLIRRGNRSFSIVTEVGEFDTLFTRLGKNSKFTGGLGVGIDFIVNAGIEYYTLSEDPYYTLEQKITRSIIRGGTNALGGAAGAAIAVSLASAICASPLAPACIGIGLLGGAVGAFTVDSMLTEPLSRIFVGPRERRLQPLSGQ